MIKFNHKPVLLDEVITGLNIKPSGIYVDCTIGGAGHSSKILEKLDSGFLYGFDRDQEAINASTERLHNFKNFKIIKSNFNQAKDILISQNVAGVDGILIDLGVSSHQIDQAYRGFSFLHDGPLDMRMDKGQELTAFDVVNNYSKERLLKILYEYGEEANAKKIVENIVKSRNLKPIETTFELKDIIENSFPKKQIYSKGGVSKKTFQAIRIEVNQELKGLEKALRDLISILNPKGRIAVISFHSLEDRIVKNVFKELSTNCICPPKTPVCICGHKAIGTLINKKPIVASKDELLDNSRSSSAKLRIFEKL